MEDKLSINEVIDQFSDWLESNWPADMSPSEYRKGLQELDDLGLMEFEEILDTYNNLYLDIDEFEFDIKDEEFESKLNECINNHISFLEEYCQDDNDSFDDEEDW